MLKLSIILITLILISGCQDNLIGGETDEYGCLGPAGYSYNETINSCIREWELTDTHKEAAKIAVEYLNYEQSVILEVISARCPGCFAVKLSGDGETRTVTIENWEVKTISLTPEECLEEGGRTLNIVANETCTENEENIGSVTGFISPNICCKPI